MYFSLSYRHVNTNKHLFVMIMHNNICSEYWASIKYVKVRRKWQDYQNWLLLSPKINKGTFFCFSFSFFFLIWFTYLLKNIYSLIKSYSVSIHLCNFSPFPINYIKSSRTSIDRPLTEIWYDIPLIFTFIKSL